MVHIKRQNIFCLLYSNIKFNLNAFCGKAPGNVCCENCVLRKFPFSDWTLNCKISANLDLILTSSRMSLNKPTRQDGLNLGGNLTTVDEILLNLLSIIFVQDFEN